MDRIVSAAHPTSLEQQLHKGEHERYRRIFEAAAIGTALSDLDGRLLETNRALRQLLGYSAEELQGMAIREFTHPEDAARQIELFRDLAAGNREYYQIEKRYIRKDGQIVWGRLTESLARDNDNNPSFTIAMVEDITERVQAEERLREREAQYRSIVEATSDGLIILDLQGRIVDANDVACAMYGYTRERFIGLDSRVLTIPEDRDRVEAGLQTIGKGGHYHIQGIAVREDSSTFHAEGRGTTFLYRAEPHILAVVRDVTEQVKAYELLEQRVEERTRELFTLLDVSRNVASMLELEPLLGLILDQLKVVAPYSGAALFLVQEEDLVVLVRRAPGPDREAGPKRYALGEAGSLWDRLQRGEMVIIDDVRGETPLARAYQASVGDHLETTFAYERSWLGAPMVAKDRVIGVITLSAKEPGYFTPHHADLALAIAQQAAIAIENARLYEKAQEVAVLEERQRLSRELHDSVSQALYGIALGTHTARTLLDRDPSQVAQPLEYVLAQAEAGLTEMRALIFELRPDALETEGLVAALDKQVAAMRARYGLAVDTTLCPEPDVPISVKEALYRIAREALNNTVKHAGAHTVRVHLDWDADRLMLELEDDGAGFDPDGAFPGHLGLRTMQERAMRFGGTLDIESAPGSGTHIRVDIPFHEAQYGRQC